jgi:hypothetical protein
MAVNDNVSRNQYTATSLQTVFPYTFEIFDDDDVVVLQKIKATGVTNTLAKTTHYTVSSVGNDNGGNITLVTGAATGDILTIYRDMALERLVDYQNSGDFKAGTVNDDFDRLWIALQQQNANAGLAIRAPTDDTVLNSTNTTLSNVATRGGKLLGFTSTGELSYSSVAAATADLVDVTTVATMTALSGLTAGVSVVTTAEFYTGTGGGGTYDVIAGTGTANGFNIIAHDTLSLSFSLRDNNIISFAQWGAAGADATLIVQDAIDEAIARGITLDVTGNYNVTTVSLTGANGLRITGRGSLVGVASVATDTILDMLNVNNIAIDGAWFINGNYNTNYTSGVWIYTDGAGQSATFLDFINVSPQNCKVAWKIGNPNRPNDLVSEINVRGGQTFGCPSAVEAHGAQTVVNFTGCTLASLTGAGNTAWLALPQRTIVANGATININGGELLHTLLSTGGATSDFNCLCVSGAFDLGGSAQYGKINVNGAVVESAARFGATENVPTLTTPTSGLIAFVGCQGVSLGNTLPLIETDVTYLGVIKILTNNFFASGVRAASHISCAALCDIYLDEQSLVSNFVDPVGGTVGGNLHFGYQMVFNGNNLNGQSLVNAVPTTLNFTSINSAGPLGRWSADYSAGVITVPAGGWKSVRIETQILKSGLTGEWYVQINGTSFGVRTLGNYNHNSYSINSLVAGDTIKIVLLNTAATTPAGSTTTDWLQVFAKN